MLSLFTDFPLAFLPPALVLAAWVACWVTGRRTGVTFFLASAAVALLIVPAALLVSYLQGPCDNPSRDTWACGYSTTLLTGTLSAVVTAGCVVGLLLLTAFLKIFDLGPGTIEPAHAGRRGFSRPGTDQQ